MHTNSLSNLPSSHGSCSEIYYGMSFSRIEISILRLLRRYPIQYHYISGNLPHYNSTSNFKPKIQIDEKSISLK